MKKNDWNPELYLKFDKERIQPSIDLLARINYDNPKTIIDIGCGPGNSTQALINRWQNAKIIGIDNSPSMIEKAKKDYPNHKWLVLDAGKDEIKNQYDIIFSNACIHWIPNHQLLIKKFSDILNDNGILAVELPTFWDMSIGMSLLKIIQNPRWYSYLKDVKDLFTIHNASYYYDILSDLFSTIDLWETSYIHIMESHLAIFEMVRSTGLKPYLDRFVDDNEKNIFIDLLLKNIATEYPIQKNGKILFQMKRLFFVAKK